MWINYDLYVNTSHVLLNLHVSTTSNATKRSKKTISKINNTPKKVLILLEKNMVTN